MSSFNYQLKLVKKPYLHHNKSSVEKKILDPTRHILFTKTHPILAILKLSIAPFVVIIINATYQLSDVVLTSTLVKDTILIHGHPSSIATIAINTSAIIYIPMWGVLMGVVQGGMAWFSKSQGMQNPKQMGVFNSSVFVMIIISSIIIALIMLSVGDGILKLSVNIPNAKDNALIVNQSFMYIWPRIATLPIIGIYLHCVRTMRVLNVKWWSILPYTVGVFLNLLLDYLLIQFGKLGIFGSGLATACAEVVSGGLALTLFIHFLKKEHHDVKLFSPKLKAMGRIILQGFPQIANLILTSILMFFTINWASSIGALGVSSVMRVVSALAIYPVFGFIQGAGIVIGYNYGWKNYKRIHTLTFWLLIAIFSYFLLLTLLIVIFSKDLLIILNIVEPNGARWLRILYIGICLLAFINALRAYYTATHQKFKTFLTLLVSALAPIPFLYLFGVYLANLELFWYANLVGAGFTLLVVLLPWYFFAKRYFCYFKKGNNDLKVWAFAFERKRTKVIKNAKK